MGFAFGWFMFSVLAGVIASSKGRSGIGFFLLSVFLTPLVGILAAAFMPRIDSNAPKPGTQIKCPDCAELILKEAKVCKHCGCKIVNDENALPAEVVCKSCKKVTKTEHGVCAYCATPFA